jgi:archaellum biogenesis protein FlaJ (TadC family)
MAAPLEERVVEVNDPKLSPDANHRLTEAVRDVIGADRVMVPSDRPHVSEGQRPRVSPLKRITSTKMMAIGLVAVAVCVGLIVATTGNHWFVLVIAFAVLAVALTTVTLSIIGLASIEEFPDPGLAALLSEQGIRDPEVRFSEFVREFTPVAEN